MSIKQLIEQWNDSAIGYMRLIPSQDREQLESRAVEAGSLLCGEASVAEIDACENRLHIKFPGTLTELLRVSNGFILPIFGTGPALFLGTSEIDYYRTRQSKSFRDWMRFATPAGMEDHDPLMPEDDIADVDLPCSSHLTRAVTLSSERGGDILLAYAVGGGASVKWEYLKLSVHARSFRCLSLRTLLTTLMQNSLDALRQQRKDG
jgi:hypothetical protein